MDERTPPGAQFPDASELPGSPARGVGSRGVGSRGVGSRDAGGGFDLDADAAWSAVRAVLEQAGERIPEEWEIEGPAVSISLGDAADLNPALLAAMCGPDGLGGQALGPQFGQDRAADVLRPGPVLAALTERSVENITTLDDDQVIGVLRAARRIENRAVWQQAVAVAELARRRKAQFEDARARKVPRGCRPGEFPADELAAELLITRNQAEHRIAVDLDLTGRLPATLAGMAAGLISGGHANTIAFYTASLSDADAAHADQVLAEAAPGLRVDQLDRKAAALEIKLDPEAARARKEHTRTTGQRVEARRELSGNASLAGRELATADVVASKAHIDAIAARLRRAGLDGTLDQLRALALTDLTQGRNPLDRLTPAPAGPAPAGPAPAGPGIGPDPGKDQNPGPDSDANPDPDLDFDPEPDPDLTPPPAPGPPAALPSLINLIVPIGTLLGWSTAPAQAGAWGLLDPDETKDIVQAASRHPRTRWCFTVTDPDGTAVAHGCSPGRYPWTPQGPGSSPPGTAPPGTDAAEAAQLRDLLRRLNVTLEPIARGTCDHRHAEDRYVPSRKLRHLVRARTATCSAPGCNAQAVHCDIDHVIPWPDGPTDECNTHPGCRRHHRCKQAPGWHVEEAEPGVMIWTTPSGRTYTTTPTVYDT